MVSNIRIMDWTTHRVYSSYLYVTTLSILPLLGFSTSPTTVPCPTPRRFPLPGRGKPFGMIGTTDFYDLVVKDGVYVDKSMLIDEYLTRLEKAMLITRPSGFGKSLNMDMLRRFLEIEVDVNGERVPKADCVNRPLFVGGNVTYRCNKTRELKRLNIADWEYTMREQGEVPVIFIRLGDVRGNSYEQFEDNIVQSFKSLSIEYRYLKKNMTNAELKFYNFFETGNVTSEQLEHFTHFLSDQLHKYFDRKVHILIDEYDAPLRNMLIDLLDGKTTTTFDAVMVNSTDFKNGFELLSGILCDALRDNPAVEKVLMTGIYPLAYTGIAVDLNNIDVREFTVFNEPFSERYGFTRDDIDDLSMKLSLDNTKRSDIERWYNGYNFAEYTLYNPCSIMRCLKEGGMCENHCANTASLKFVAPFLLKNHVKERVRKLLDGGTVDVNVTSKPEPLRIFMKGDIFRYFLFIGYLTPASNEYDGHLFTLKITNYEVKTEMTKFLEWLSYEIGSETEDDATNMSKLLAHDKIELFKEWFKKNRTNVDA